jgi:hypothetical protein
MRKLVLIFILISIIFISAVYFAYAHSLPKWFNFHSKNSLNEWQEKVFKNRVLYVVKPKEEGGYLLAKSQKSCSALLYKIKLDPKKFPMISWKWKIIKFPQKSGGEYAKGGWLEKDDYAARVYVIFSSWIFTHIKCIEYVWDENMAEGTIITSPYLHNIKLIVVESGKKSTNQWAFEERNIYADYKRAFGRTPGQVDAIALMTDSDNTLSTDEASYTDIKVGYKK